MLVCSSSFGWGIKKLQHGCYIISSFSVYLEEYKTLHMVECSHGKLFIALKPTGFPQLISVSLLNATQLRLRIPHGAIWPKWKENKMYLKSFILLVKFHWKTQCLHLQLILRERWWWVFMSSHFSHFCSVPLTIRTINNIYLFWWCHGESLFEDILTAANILATNWILYQILYICEHLMWAYVFFFKIIDFCRFSDFFVDFLIFCRFSPKRIMSGHHNANSSSDSYHLS